MHPHHSNGFSLLDTVIVTAMISLFLAVTVPAYQRYLQVRTAAEHSCLDEASAYTLRILSRVRAGGVVNAPDVRACDTIDNAAGMNLAVLSVITAKSKAPGQALFACDLANAGLCTLQP